MEQFLRRNFPRDILMPVRRGEKSPMYPHKNDSWSWHLYEGAAKRGLDVCVLLKDLCVVDVDSRELEAELEARFPELRVAPKELTARGAHYWFARSPEADRDGHFDARAPRIQGVDFKTRCRNGTAGVVVIAPSTGRTWVRQPGVDGHEVGLIPVELLEAVSKPCHARVSRVFTFEGGETAQMDVCNLDVMEFFEPFFDAEAFNADEPIPVPVDRATFELLLTALAHGDVGTPTREAVGRVLRAADLLGLNREEYRRLVTGRLLWGYDLRNAGCHVLVGNDTDAAVEVPEEDIIFEPLRAKAHDERWLFHNTYPKGKAGDVVVAAGRLRFELPDFVHGLIVDFPLMLAGGSVLAHLTGSEDFHDYDLFPLVKSELEATAMVEKIRGRLEGDVRVRQTGCALTLVMPDELIVQIILRLYDSPAQVLGSFDIAPCKVGVYVDEEEGLKTVALPCWFAAVRHRAFVLEHACWSAASVMRTLKYIARGYDCFVPGLRRAALVDDLRWGERGRDMSALLWAERKLSVRDREPRFDRIMDSEVSKLMKRPTEESEYNLFVKATNRIVWAVRALARWVGISRKQARTLQWARHGASGGRAFFTTSPRTFAAYDHPMYEKLVETEMLS